MNRIRIVVLHLFVSQVLNYVSQLHAHKANVDEVFEPEDKPALEETTAIVQVSFQSYTSLYQLRNDAFPSDTDTNRRCSNEDKAGHISSSS